MHMVGSDIIRRAQEIAHRIREDGYVASTCDDAFDHTTRMDDRQLRRPRQHINREATVVGPCGGDLGGTVPHDDKFEVFDKAMTSLQYNFSEAFAAERNVSDARFSGLETVLVQHAEETAARLNDMSGVIQAAVEERIADLSCGIAKIEAQFDSLEVVQFQANEPEDYYTDFAQLRFLIERKLQYVEKLAEQTQEAFERSAIKMGEEWKFVPSALARDFPLGFMDDLQPKITTTQLDLHRRIAHLEDAMVSVRAQKSPTTENSDLLQEQGQPP